MVSEIVISAVDHVIEHPKVWTERVSKTKWGDRIPHMDRRGDGRDYWVVDGRKFSMSAIAGVGALLSDRAGVANRWDDIPKPAYDPAARLEAMDHDGIRYAVLYPMFAGFSGERLAAVADADLALACVQAYNDWIIDEWAAHSDRFVPLCLVPITPVDAAVLEIKRSIANGHKGVIFAAVPMHLREVPHINGPEYDPVWSICEELDVPLCFHAGSSDKLRFPWAPALNWEMAAALEAVTRPASAVFDLVNTLFSRILLRFPKLKVVFAESTAAWGTFLLEYADHQYEQDHCHYELKPSEMFRRQCFLTTWYDPLQSRARHLGPTNILWAANFPMANSTWPESQAFIERCCAGLDEHERRQILSGNAAKLYKIRME